MIIKWLYLIVGGVLGTVSRYSLSGFISQRINAGFPLGTLVVNLTGCFFVGFLDVIFEKKFLLSPEHRILLITGFCGAFTTFSTLIFETSNLLKENEFVYAFSNVLVSFLVGFVLFKFGALLAELF